MATRVLTLPAPEAAFIEAPVIRLHLKRPDAKPLDLRVAELKDNILTSEEIPDAIKARVASWYAKYASRFTLGGNSSLAARALCFMLFNAIHPVIQDHQKDKAILAVASGFNEEITSLIATLIPRDVDVDDYIEELEVVNDRFNLSEKLATQVKPSVEDLLEDEMQALRERQAYLFAMQRDALLAHAGRMEEEEESLNAAVAALTGSVHALAEEMLAAKRRDEALNKQFAQEKVAAEKLTATAEHVFKGMD